VYEGPVEDPADPLVSGLPATVPVPHSRMNDVPEAALLEAGYEIVVGSGRPDVGWSVAARQRGEGRFVLCQGHPEYGTLSLLREYRRDVRRFLFGRGAVPYPKLPEAYFGPDAASTLQAFERRAKTFKVDPMKLWERFPYEEAAAGIENSWASASTTFYANWLGLTRPVALPER
jgi:homoserine O-succinyltransferase